MDTSKITNVLIFKDGFYWLTIKRKVEETEVESCNCERIEDEHYHLKADGNDTYQIVPDSWKIPNGFEFASDAYAYIVSLQPEKELKDE